MDDNSPIAPRVLSPGLNTPVLSPATPSIANPAWSADADEVQSALNSILTDLPVEQSLQLVPISALEAEAAIAGGAQLLTASIGKAPKFLGIRSHKKRLGKLMFYINFRRHDGTTYLEGVPLHIAEELYTAQLRTYLSALGPHSKGPLLRAYPTLARIVAEPNPNV